jgi:PAS domain S-box-containing protein
MTKSSLVQGRPAPVDSTLDTYSLAGAPVWVDAVIESLPDAICVKDRDLVYRYVNRAFADRLGLEPEACIGKRSRDLYPPEAAMAFEAADQAALNAGTGSTREVSYDFQGMIRWSRSTSTPILDDAGEVTALFWILSDISAEKRANAKLAARENSLLRMNYARSALGAASNALVHAENEPELVHAVCDAIAADDRFLAFFAWKPADPEADIAILALSGKWKGFLDGVHFNWSDGPLGAGAAGSALRTGRTHVINDLLASPAYSPWRDRIREADVRAMMGLPILCEGETSAVLAVYAREINAFGKEEVALFEEFARNLSFGIRTLRMNAAYRSALQREVEHSHDLSRLLNQTIEAVAAVAEHRDPYTAQHQIRVSELAVAIGREMGLGEHRCEGLRLAASVHDIGKVEVPTDILTKPRKLTPAEFEMIKIHPAAGYEILKGIDFPWPIAEMVYQHHECLDGSGYPRGLKGDEIMLEAQIVSIADIVEAVSGHRPYRPALGLKAAFDILRRLAGTKLNAEVVRVCIDLIESKRFTLAS